MVRFVLLVFPLYLQNSGHTAFFYKVCAKAPCTVSLASCCVFVIHHGMRPIPPYFWCLQCNSDKGCTQALPCLFLLSWFSFPSSLLFSWHVTKQGSSPKLPIAKSKSGPGEGSFIPAGTFSSASSSFTFTLCLSHREHGFSSLHNFPTSYLALFSLHDFRVSKASMSYVWKSEELQELCLSQCPAASSQFFPQYAAALPASALGFDQP